MVENPGSATAEVFDIFEQFCESYFLLSILHLKSYIVLLLSSCHCSVLMFYEVLSVFFSRKI